MIANDNHSTIVACATPVGIAGIAVIRLSGPNALDYARQFFSKKLIEPQRVAVGNFVDPVTVTVIDQICLLYFQAPQSYTGQDCIEIHCHSSPYIIKKVIGVCLQLGAQLAAAGEFTKRAFFNGKLSLTQAESVIDLIHCETELQHSVSLNRVEGKLYKHIIQFRNQYLTILQQLEASIDFPDEVDAIDRTVVLKTCTNLQQQIDKIIQLQDFGKTISNGIHCVILGRPNAGKSALFNQLLQEDRSIVTPIEGTTRDYIKESIEYNGVNIVLYDTAGLRDSSDTVEYLGMQKVQDLIKKADIILWVVDGASLEQDAEKAIGAMLQQYNNVALLINKSDLPQQINKLTEYDFIFTQQCSIKDSNSIATLKENIFQYKAIDYQAQDLEFLCNIRQEACLAQLATENSQLLTSLTQVIHDDVLAIEVRKCVEICSELTGDAITEELLDGIFARFCVGK